MADVKNYAVEPTDLLIEQLDILSQTIAYKDSKIRIMPDGHPGKGAVVGSTITYTDKIIPNTVGVDIACRVSLFSIPNNINLQRLDEVIHRVVPVGFNVRNSLSKYDELFNYNDLRCWEYLDKQTRIRLSMGSLGGGNHYISVDKNQDTGELFLCIHTGSRNLGTQVCNYYQQKAEKQTDEIKKSVYAKYDRFIKRYRNLQGIIDLSIEMPKLLQEREEAVVQAIPEKGLEYITGKDMEDYLYDMEFINKWSKYNHLTIADAIGEEMGFIPELYHTCIHNYVDVKNGIIRKGAISAYEGEVGIIPLNMRDGVLVVVGKGNEDWNYSLPHGAGRLLARGEARRGLSLNDFVNAMNGVYSTCVVEETLDESPMAYKDAEAIIAAIEPNAEVIAHLQEIYNFKSTK